MTVKLKSNLYVGHVYMFPNFWHYSDDLGHWSIAVGDHCTYALNHDIFVAGGCMRT